jgi:hypothetical protein
VQSPFTARHLTKKATKNVTLYPAMANQEYYRGEGGGVELNYHTDPRRSPTLNAPPPTPATPAFPGSSQYGSSSQGAPAYPAPAYSQQVSCLALPNAPLLCLFFLARLTFSFFLLRTWTRMRLPAQKPTSKRLARRANTPLRGLPRLTARFPTGREISTTPSLRHQATIRTTPR